MYVISIILAEAELERVPQQILSHPSVRIQAKQKKKPASQLILDASIHHSAMNSLFEGRKRGRPDITHIFLLCVLESLANKDKMIKNIIIHTRNGEAIQIHPETRIMRNYPRFIGLMEQLFEKQVINAGKTMLMKLQNETMLDKIVKDLNADHVTVCSDIGQMVDINNHLTILKEKDSDHLACIIGGFPSGSFHSDINSLTDDIICLHKEKLTAWTTVNEVLTWYHYIFSK
jgi:rRNA small subunit pseudouridine methyltransferase Nep1